MKIGWYIITKSYKGGRTYYAIRITRKLREFFQTTDALLEYVGEKTNGGHNEGYTIHMEKSELKPYKPGIKTIVFVEEKRLCMKIL